MMCLDYGPEIFYTLVLRLIFQASNSKEDKIFKLTCESEVGEGSAEY